MRVLVACEESQVVTMELRRLGHEAYSCDIQDCSGGHPEWHIKGDALKIINPEYYDGRFGITPSISFYTQNDDYHQFDGKWDMIIAHPLCTYLSCAGAQRTFPQPGVPDPVRYAKGEEAAKFFKAFLEADCPRIAVENPRIMRCFGIPAYSQEIHPWMFGHPWHKRTCLWLKGLPPLFATDVVVPTGYWVQRNSDPKLRSKTFPGIARAMAEAWAGPAEKGV